MSPRRVTGWETLSTSSTTAIPFLAAVIGATAKVVRERLAQRQRQKQAPSPPLNPWTAVAPFIGWDAVTLVILLLGANGLASIVGTATAKREVEFLTLDDPSGYVVLRVYDDAFIAASLNRAERTVGPEVRVFSPETVVARRDAVGPLKPVRIEERSLTPVIPNTAEPEEAEPKPADPSTDRKAVGNAE